MAFVHTSVNRTSQSYLSNEQRYNYTTPKSFLEFIRLYQSLLRRNGRELRSKMERLENGLLKLHSTSAQVSSVLPVLLSTAGSEGGKGSPFPEGGDHSHTLKTKPQNSACGARKALSEVQALLLCCVLSLFSHV